MIAEVLDYLRNDFSRAYINGTFTVENGTITLPNVQSGQYVRIVGSVFNDGVYQTPLEGLADETFTGTIRLLSIPCDLMKEIRVIEKWCDDNPALGAFQSESGEGYSYTVATIGGTQATWQNVFGKRLRRWKKVM